MRRPVRFKTTSRYGISPDAHDRFAEGGRDVHQAGIVADDQRRPANQVRGSAKREFTAGIKYFLTGFFHPGYYFFCQRQVFFSTC